MAEVEGRRMFVPGALPGEQARVRLGHGPADLIEIETPSPDRVVPPCTLFGTCGGCAIQQLSLPALAQWKADRVGQALMRAGFASVTPKIEQVLPLTRRRIDLAAKRVSGGVILGLHRRQGDPVDMTECHILDPRLFALLAPLRIVLASLGALTADGDVLLNLLDSGPDILLATDVELGAADRTKLAAFARAQGVPRIGWRSRRGRAVAEIVAQTGPVRQNFAGASVSPPLGAFLQAAPDGERAIVKAVIAALPKLNRRDVIAELYAGCGTLTFPLAEHGRVCAFEGDAGASAAVRRAMAGRRIEITARDLGRQPLMSKELSDARLCVLDPPYSGAAPQIGEIAASSLRDVIYVSCNPQALEADASRLHQAGFTLESITVVDQFLWSTEVESVIAFRRGSSRRTRSGPSRSG
ncbi:class I SAM-dependent RNA methyltransferase [Tanticharoenia sakaeratensis]|uniref:class I SAM-dependent RNA methyltransferase n=1 Tax=Tanticharoenia sakaeratensis TaxID=444053 RepID=UPI001F523D01|nr:class I SAM-dependent RNA methyltransferase [Tanticharoenia sakaeratensis]